MRRGEESHTNQDETGRQNGGIVCAGNFIVDRVHTLSYWPEQGNLAHIQHQDIGVGGGAANVVTDLASFGFPGRLAAAGCVGADADGKIVRSRLANAGIDVEGIKIVDGHATAHTHVMNVPGKSRTFFYHGGANEVFDETMVEAEALATAGYRVFYLGYVMLLPGLDGDGTGAARLLEAAKAAGLVTCVDFVSSEDPAFPDRIAPILPFCDYLIINEIEAERATGIPARDATGKLLHSSVVEAGQKLLDGGVSGAVVVHAPEMCIWLAKDAEPFVSQSRPIDPAAIVSPVGAGDAFCAGVLYGLHEGWAVETICNIAHLAAFHCLGGATATDSIPHMSVLLEEQASITR